jgi:hypothetical protein
MILIILIRSRDSVVGIVTGYELDDRGVGVQVTVGSKFFSSPRRLDRLWGGHVYGGARDENDGF